MRMAARATTRSSAPARSCGVAILMSCNSSSVTDYLLDFGYCDFVVGQAAVVLLPQVLQVENRREQRLEVHLADSICGHRRGLRGLSLRDQTIAIDRHNPFRGAHHNQTAFSTGGNLQLRCTRLLARGLGFERGLLNRGCLLAPEIER